MPAEKIDCNRLSYTDLDEKCLRKFDVWDFVPASDAHRSRKLMSPATLTSTCYSRNNYAQRCA